MTKNQGQNSGFSLIELILTIVILGFTTLIIIPFAKSVIHSPDPLIRQRAVSLGQALMDEILAKRWDENTPLGGGPVITSESAPPARGLTATSPSASAIGPDGGETDRTLYDDVDDYNNFTETDSFTDQNGNTFNLSGYTRAVAIRYINSNADPINAGMASAAGFTDSKMVMVNITTPQGESLVFTGVSCNI